MCEEYLLVITCNSVGVSVEDEPTTADGIIDEEVLSVFEIVPPSVACGFNDVNGSFTSSWALCQSYGYE